MRKSLICFIPLIVHGSNMDVALKYFEIYLVYERKYENMKFCDLDF